MKVMHLCLVGLFIIIKVLTFFFCSVYFQRLCWLHLTCWYTRLAKSFDVKGVLGHGVGGPDCFSGFFLDKSVKWGHFLV